MSAQYESRGDDAGSQEHFATGASGGEDADCHLHPDAYKRPDGRFVALLAALATQEAVPNCQFTIVVVDNEGSPRTKAICDEFALKLHFPLRYCSESRRGLSYVRN